MPYTDKDQVDWMVALEKESHQPFEKLMSVHETLNQSRDSHMLYCAAWAALYASQKLHDQSEAAFDLAREGFRRVAEEPLVSVYGWTSKDVPLRAEFALALAQSLRNPRTLLSPAERSETYQGLEGVLTKSLAMAESGSGDALGALGEIVVTSLCWRPTPQVLSVFNTIPAGPSKDARVERLRPFATDLYAYTPTIEPYKKGRVNIQVKTTQDPKHGKVYDSTMVVVGLNEVVHHEGEQPLKGRRASKRLAKKILSDMANEPLGDSDEEMLLYTGAEIYDRILTAAEAKHQRYLRKTRREAAVTSQ